MASAGELDRNDKRAPSAAWPRFAFRGLLACLALGLLCRGVRYFLQFPMWGDEGLVLLDILDCDYYALTQPLPVFQIAPLLFLWAERAALDFVGSSELVMRLPAFLAGTAGLALFALIARRSLTAMHGLLAVALLAVAYHPIRHSCEVKPYALDLLASVALMLGAVGWLRAPHGVRWLAFLTCWAPVALLASFPAAFVAGGVSAALLPKMRAAPWRVRAWYVAFNVAMVAAFAGNYYTIVRNQVAGPVCSDRETFLQDYWQDAFPPRALLELPVWLITIHCGGILAVPVGGAGGASAASFVLACLGGWYLWRRGQRSLLLVCMLPFALTLVAAFLHKYPYGGSPRIAQHVAPMASVLIAGGIALLAEIGRAAPPVQWRRTAVVLALLAAIGGIGIVRDVCKPYKNEHDRSVRDLVQDLWAHVAPGERIVICDRIDQFFVTADWYLRRDRPDIPCGTANPELPPDAPGVWLVHFGSQAVPGSQLVNHLGDRADDWFVADCRWRWLPPEYAGDAPTCCTQVRLRPTAGSPGVSAAVH